MQDGLKQCEQRSKTLKSSIKDKNDLEKKMRRVVLNFFDDK